jgi:hypothetical protein
MPQGDKRKYTAKQKRKAEKIARGYERRGTSKKEASRRAWATVNAMDKGGKKSGSGRGKKPNRAPARKGGKRAAASRAAKARAGRKGGRATAARRRSSSRRSSK